ncbi:MAG: Fur family transcriptional regulator, partial [Acholeplasmataceae bacterium]
SSLPLSSEEIYAKLSNKHINLSTVYRSLETFFERNMVMKTIINQKQYYYVGHHHHFLFCTQCHKMIPVGCSLEGKEKALGEPYGFEVTHHDMTIYGLCQTCQTH